MQLAVAVNNLAMRTLFETQTPVAEMPHDISLPLGTLSDVDGFEKWLKDSRNSYAKEKMVCVSSEFSYTVMHTADTGSSLTAHH